MAKQSKPDKHKPDQKELRARLREMVDLNNPVGLVRPELLGIEPLAYGRLIEWTDEHLLVEELQIIGRKVRVGPQDDVQAFVGRTGDLLSFSSKVLKLSQPARLNQQMMIKTLRLASPQKLSLGNRRTAFRAPLSAHDDVLDARVWFIDRAGLRPDADEEPVPEPEQGCSEPCTGSCDVCPQAEDEAAADETRSNKYYVHLEAAIADNPLPGYAPDRSAWDVEARENAPEPEEVDWQSVTRKVGDRDHHAFARVTDLTAGGIGLMFFGISGMQLKRFEHLVIELHFDDGPVRVVGEVRQCKDLGGRRAKIGLMLVYPSPRDVRDPTRQKLERRAIEVERALLEKKRRDAA